MRAEHDREVEASVVIPTYNRPQRLAGCLEALCGLENDARSFEVLVVDDGSPCDLEPVVSSFANELTLSLIRQPNRGPASARNAGVRAARAPWVALTDDDCRPRSGWLTRLLQVARQHPDTLIFGETHNLANDSPFSTASHELLEFLYGYLNPDPDDVVFMASNNMAVPRSAFLELGGFDERFPLAAAEDRDLCDRWRHFGRRMVYAPGAIVGHRHEMDLQSFLRQHINYGRGAVFFKRLKRARDGRRPPLQTPAFYWRMLRHPSVAEVSRPAMIAGLIALAQISEIVGYGAGVATAPAPRSQRG